MNIQDHSKFLDTQTDILEYIAETFHEMIGDGDCHIDDDAMLMELIDDMSPEISKRFWEIVNSDNDTSDKFIDLIMDDIRKRVKIMFVYNAK